MLGLLIWFIGETSIGVWDGKQFRHQSVPVNSYALNSKTCELWVEGGGVLKRFSSDLNAKPMGSSGTVLYADESYLYRLADERLRICDSNGTELFTTPAPWGNGVVQFIPTAQGFAVLQEVDSELRLVLLNRELQETKTVRIAKSEVLFGNQKLLWDADRKLLWIGFSASSPEHFYTPFVQARKLDGELVVEHRFRERGLFFDFCISETGQVIAGRDIPSNSGFTVPVYSFLEELSVTGTIRTLYALHENYFPDSFLCQGEEKLIVERSIFGSDGSRVSSWKNASSAEPLFKLPAPMKQVLACE